MKATRLRRHLFPLALVVAFVWAFLCVYLHISRGGMLEGLIPFAILYGFVDWKWGRDSLPPRPASPKNAAKYVSPYEVTFDATEIVVTLRGKRRESVKWDDLIFVGIRIEDAGFIDVPCWILGGSSSGCIYPSDAIGSAEMLREMQSRLPGFDNHAVIQAMGISGGVKVWERESQVSAPPPTA